jgi:hypothetical protein
VNRQGFLYEAGRSAEKTTFQIVAGREISEGVMVNKTVITFGIFAPFLGPTGHEKAVNSIRESQRVLAKI